MSLCEGLYKQPISAQIEVVSVLVGGLLFDAAVDRKLEISVHDPAIVPVETLNVRAVSLPLRTYYRMDARLPKVGALTWPLDTVVKPQQMKQSEIGLFGWTGAGKDMLYVPLRVRGEGAEAPAAAAVVVGVRAHQTFDDLVWRITAERDDAEYGPWTRLDRRVRRGERVEIELPPGPAEVVRLEVEAKRKDEEDWLHADARILRAAR